MGQKASKLNRKIRAMTKREFYSSKDDYAQQQQKEWVEQGENFRKKMMKNEKDIAELRKWLDEEYGNLAYANNESVLTVSEEIKN